mmetsp:Transcript_52958/g.172360  ORF Transcript_52958/g.172360 Transcript_52958/m.172360 type:complete len:298 (-) Transcript_52958:582-1475(-)
MHHHPRAHHRREEIGVVDGGIMVRVKCLEGCERLVFRDMELVHENMLELAQQDSALIALVHRDEVLPHRRTLFVGEGPRHQLHAAASELRGLAELPEAVDDAPVDLHTGHLVPLVDPRVLQGNVGGEALPRIDLKEPLDEAEGLFGHRAPPVFLEGVLAGQYVRFLYLLAAGERHVPAEQDEGDDPQTPEVALLRVVLLQNLRGDVRQGAAAVVHLYVRVPDLAETKVYEHQVVTMSSVVEEVFQLEVPVHDAVTVQVVQRQKHLSRRLGRILLGVPRALRDAVEKLAALKTLHDQI